MNTTCQSVCPLCKKAIGAEQLFAHMASDHEQWRHSTIKVIRAYHPNWIEEDGACPTCWKSYRNATQILRLLKQSSSAMARRQ
jgi:hypothetical protein